MVKVNDLKGISRIDSGSTHGWFVRGYKNGKTYSKLYSDGKWGGRDKALAAAKLFRDSLADRLEKIPAKPRARRLVFRDSRNSTGVLGVSRIVKRTPRGTIHESYSVSWRPEPGVQKSTSFAIRKYGEKKAFQMAVAFRRKMLREIYGPGVFRKLKQKAEEAGTSISEEDVVT